jgi:hypothetical protein
MLRDPAPCLVLFFFSLLVFKSKTFRKKKRMSRHSPFLKKASSACRKAKNIFLKGRVSSPDLLTFEGTFFKKGEAPWFACRQSIIL